MTAGSEALGQNWKRSPHARADLSIWLLALAVRLAYLWELHRFPVFSLVWGDAGSYEAWARQIAAGDLLGKGVFFQAPLYPYFLGALHALFGSGLTSIRVAQAILGATSCLFLAWSGRVFFSARAGTIAGVLLAVYPVAIFYDGSIQKSSLDLFFLTLLLLALGRTTVQHRRRWWFVAGVALGSLMLTRENSLALAPVVLAWAAASSRGEARGQLWPRLGLFAAGVALLLLPVGLRNVAVGGEFHLTTSNFGPTFFVGNNPAADGTSAPLRPGRANVAYEQSDAKDLAEQALGRELSPGEISRYWTLRAWEFIRGEPVAWLKLLLRKTLLAWNRVEIADSEDQASFGEWSLIMRWLTRIFHFGVLAPLAALGFVLAWPRRSRTWLLSAVLGAYLASVVVFVVFARYRFPLVPVLVLFAAAGLAEAFDLVRLGQPRRLAPALLALGLAAIVCNWPLLPGSGTSGRALTQNNVGAALLATPGRERDALVAVEAALRLVPDFDAAYVNRGVAMRRLGRPDEAIAAFQRALHLSPGSPDTHVLLGEVLVDEGRLQEALPHLAAAVEVLPRDAVVRFRYGCLLDDLGHAAEAARQLEESVRLDPKAWEALNNLGLVQFRMGNRNAALATFRRAAALNPESPSVLQNLGSALFSLGRIAEATGSLERAVALQPDCPEALDGLGLALEAQGRASEAADRYRQALRVRPGDTNARLHLTRVLGRRP
jgi:tetratricopeptide (TPR) repeat protein